MPQASFPHATNNRYRAVRVQNMDSPIVAQLFRQLFRHPACQSRRNLATLSSCLRYGRRVHQLQHEQRRHKATRPHIVRGAKKGLPDRESHWQQRSDLFSIDMSDEYKAYPTVTANSLRSKSERPRQVKMLMRDFIEGLLFAYTAIYRIYQITINLLSVSR